MQKIGDIIGLHASKPENVGGHGIWVHNQNCGGQNFEV